MTRSIGLLSAAAVLAVSVSHALADDQIETTHAELEPIRIELGPSGEIETMAMNRDGDLLLGVSWLEGAAERPSRGNASGRPPRGRSPLEDEPNRKFALKVVTTDGKVKATWPMQDMAPKMLHACPDGDVYVFGGHKLARFSEDGKLKKSIGFGEIMDGKFDKAHAAGITACDDYVFVAFGYGFSLRATEDFVRLDRDLAGAKLVVEKQYGCCSHIDLDVQGDVLLIAENSRHRVNRFTLDGEKLDTWGSRTRTSIEGFAACCNPVNFDFGPGGVLYTAESGIGRVKRYTADGKYLGMVGYVDTTKFDRGSWLAATSCYIPVEVSADGSRVYVMDVRANFIRVLAEK